ncbi:hypothetical protein FSP39_023056 [Pinctada imbricata]|uniref:Tc1-like transposase DDE domain-containing protein n=1 Tax=Pinctada imbricata TaxID=66713 RepID=A0AA88XWZ5_PINIB|nr:hypothetical protein FSP39_023056 [Pinctada imbricata]
MYRDQGYEVVYLDETWVNKNHSTDFMWLPSDSSDAPKIPSGKGKRLIVLHAGTAKEGLIKGCDLVFVAKTKEGDYHNEMNSEVFLDWFENQLLPALKAPSVIVLDNASYHNTKTEQTTTPNMNNRKAVMQEWLQQHHITFAQSDTKPVLYEKIKRHKPQIVYQTDELAHQNGHVVLRTPVRHCELTPIELIWAQIKGNVAKNNTTFKLTDVKALVFREFDKITYSVWEKAESHVKKIENEYRKTDGVVEVSPIIINLCDSDDD